MSSEYKSVLKQFLSETIGEKHRLAEFPSFRDLCLKNAGKLRLSKFF